MKKVISSIFMGMAAMFAITACTPETEDIFSETSSERIDRYTREVKEVLQNAPNGWRAEYYASTSYGGYNVFMKFDDKNVTIASEKLGDSHNGGVDANGELNLETAHYKIEQSMGAILSVDAHNSVFHYYAEPKNPDGYGDSGDGMYGDFEFRVISASADSVILRGKKHQSKVCLYPVAKEKTWLEEYNKIQQTEKIMSARTYYLFQNGQSKDITITTSYRSLVFEYDNEEGVATRTAVPYIVTEEGFKLYRSYTVNGITVDGFKIGEDGIYVATNDPNIYIESQVLPLYEQLISSMWFIKVEDLGEFAQPYWATFHDKLEKAGANESKATLYWAMIGKYNSKLGFHFNAGGDVGTLGMKFNEVSGVTDGSQVQLLYSKDGTDKTGTKFYDSFGVKEAVTPFIGKSKVSKKVFTLSTDNARRPSYMILTDVDEPTNVIKLYADQLYYPFGDEPLD